MWTGIEYMSASHMIMRGLVDEGLDIVRAARDRHDGSRRNPWNDIECGSYYARSMSAWQLVNAWSGLQRRSSSPAASASRQSTRATSRCSGRPATASAQLIRRGKELTLDVLGGSLDVVRNRRRRLGVHRFATRRAIDTGERLALQFAPGQPTVA